jgi:NADPH:quinone reductase-like Zn-dependent oxidoreductase
MMGHTCSRAGNPEQGVHHGRVYHYSGGLTVLPTTRRPERAAALTAIGVDHVIGDDGEIAPKVRAIIPTGVEVALELVGTPTLPDTLHATAQLDAVER